MSNKDSFQQRPTCLAVLGQHRSVLHCITPTSTHHAVNSCCINTNESKTVGGCKKKKVEYKNTSGKKSKILCLPAWISDVVGGYPLGTCPVYMQILKKKMSKTFHWRVIAEPQRFGCCDRTPARSEYTFL